MNNLLILVIAFAAGIVLRKLKKFPEQTPAVLNTFIIYVSLPALVLSTLHKAELSAGFIIPALMPWAQFFIAMLLFSIIGKLRGWSRETIACVTLVCGLGNTSFLGLPMIEAFFGKEALPVGIIADQLGTFPALSVFGIAIAASASGASRSWRGTLKKIFTFPPFIAVLAALLLMPVPFHPAVQNALERLGATLSPIALVSVGYQFRLSGLAEFKEELFAGLTLKMILFPALFAAMLFFIPQQAPFILPVTVFEAAMPPMITAAIITSEYKLNAKLAAALVGTGIILSFLTLPAWHLLLSRIFGI